VQDKQAVDAAQELLDEAERNSAAMRLQEISVAEQAAKDKASADRRRWILVLIGSGAIGYWIYRRYFKNKRR
jgi:CHASE3 domain sensor protein